MDYVADVRKTILTVTRRSLLYDLSAKRILVVVRLHLNVCA